MADLHSGDLSITVTATGGTVRLDWKGKSNSREPAKILGPFFAEVARDASAVEMHFEALAHFNSSTITSLIQFIQTARSRKLRLAIFFDAAQKWQRLSFDALRIFDKSDGLLSFKNV